MRVLLGTYQMCWTGLSMRCAVQVTREYPSYAEAADESDTEPPVLMDGARTSTHPELGGTSAVRKCRPLLSPKGACSENVLEVGMCPYYLASRPLTTFRRTSSLAAHLLASPICLTKLNAVLIKHSNRLGKAPSE